MALKSAKIIVRDIGFGDSIYVNVVRDNGENIAYLIDTGYLNKEKAYKNKLKADGINKIDTLILTHKHSDHISAANFLPILLIAKEVHQQERTHGKYKSNVNVARNVGTTREDRNQTQEVRDKDKEKDGEQVRSILFVMFFAYRGTN